MGLWKSGAISTRTRRTILKRSEGTYAALAIFLVLIGLTLYQSLSVYRESVADAARQFESRIGEINAAISQRLLSHENALRGGAALFAATNVRREDWAKYVEKLDLNRNYPGVQGLGFAEVIAPEDVSAFVERVRAEGYPEFNLWPEGKRATYTSIVYLEPFDWRNQRAFGFDMFSDPTRRAAMIKARDTGEAKATQSVSLVQETGVNAQRGFLIYLPVYADGQVPATVAERREQLIGYVYSPFRMRDLMTGIFGSASGLNDLRLQIYDEAGEGPGMKIFDSAADPDSEVDGEFRETLPFEFNDHQWTLRFFSRDPIEALADPGKALVVMGAGIVISFLLAGLVWAVGINRQRSWALSQANVDLLEEMAQRENLELRLDRFFSLSGDLLCTVNEDCTFRQVNPACQKILGFESQALVGAPFLEFVHKDDRDRAEHELKILTSKKVSRTTMEIRNLAEDGGVRWVEWHFVAAEQEPAFYGNGRDVTERKQLEQELHRSAFYDKLTGTANRSLFLDRLKHVIDRSQRYGESYAAMIMDMDNFKTVNDSYGHLTGDKLLAAFAQRVQQQLRPVDTCARFGGDEFIVLLEEAASREDVGYIAERIQAAVELPFVFDGLELRVGSSMGITMGDSRYKTTHEVLRDADMALYEAKNQGKNRSIFFDQRMRTEQMTRTVVQAELSNSLERQELEVVYQPVVALDSNCTVGCEALIRWKHSQLGEMSPSEFIPIAEKSGLITALGRFVTERACEDLSRWLEIGVVSADCFVSVNLSPREFFVGDLVARVQETLERNGLEGRHLRLEVTEGVLIESSQEAAVIFAELQAMGVRICIDDFGTGYSSLSYLQSLPIDVLKLDRSLIQQIPESPKSREIARTVLNLATALDVQSVAEGAETEEHLSAIRQLGFRFAQGFILHRPMPASQMEELLRHEGAGRTAGRRSSAGH
ncbi:MAG: hypothetical protein CL583_07195 [Alteromonadaceae bacterium]|uniref:EAL domain-containing protein n=1 Tax=Hydrocarboniclastica marina TaxID=2259620 RepID=A0A4P7XKW4_9ALTE|nr:hypothetical protein [Alteromonadaceae bacterium]QCF26992.1 EAL domain-containing protein [Hydrocarboniclastica marina]